jgi:hypothetical protein
MNIKKKAKTVDCPVREKRGPFRGVVWSTQVRGFQVYPHTNLKNKIEYSFKIKKQERWLQMWLREQQGPSGVGTKWRLSECTKCASCLSVGHTS